jgi:hypothetical protein
MFPEKKFVGPRAVKTVVVDSVKTYSGAEVVVVHYEGGLQELMPKKTFELIATTEPSDFTIVRNKKLDAILAELYPVIAEYLKCISGGTEEKKKARTELLQKSLSVISEWDIKLSEAEAMFNAIDGEIAGLLNAIDYEVSGVFNRATNFLWTRDDSGFVPGVNVMSDRTILEAKKINEQIPIKVVEEEKSNDAPEQTKTE